MPGVHHQPLMRPPDDDALAHAVRQVGRESIAPLAFGGHVRDGVLRLSAFAGVRTRAMRGLQVEHGRGLGGHVLAFGRPYAVGDYRRSSGITHHYDRVTGHEGIRSAFAAPVVVRGAVRCVMFAGFREIRPVGDQAAAALLDWTARLAAELAVRDEVDRRLELLVAAAQPVAADVPAAPELREVHAELRAIARELAAPELADRLRRAADRLASSAGPATPDERARGLLASRELDVLGYVSLGCTNAEIAQRLSIGPETVKAYLRSAARKLGTHGRQQAVAAAHRHGLLP